MELNKVLVEAVTEVDNIIEPSKTKGGSVLKSSKRFSGVYHYSKKNGSKVFYYGISDPITKKWTKIKVGSSEEGISEAYAAQVKAAATLEQLKAKSVIQIVKDYTFGEIAEEYFQDQYTQKPNRQKSIKKEQSLYNKHLAPYFKDINIKIIQLKDLEDLKKKMLREDYSASTINNVLAKYSAICNYAIRQMDVDVVNFIETKKLKKLKVSNTVDRYLSQSEIKMLFEAIQEKPQLLLFVTLALATAARLQTLLNIKKIDLDLENDIVSLKDFKNDSHYYAYLPSSKININYINSLEPQQYVIGGKMSPLADTTIAKPLRNIFNEHFNKGIDKSDRANRINIHGLRRTAASHWALHGIPLYEISQMLNHSSSLQVTERYARLSKNAGLDKAKQITMKLL